MDDLQWHRPTRPGDVLRVRHEVTGRRESSSHPDAGIVVRDVEVLDDEDAVLCSWTTTTLMGKREP
jgi:acyl dehydratase